MKVKEIWTDSDFEDMGWHDSRLYSVKFPDDELELKLDIDYIFKWEEVKGEKFKFWIAPCDLIFSEVLSLKLEIDFSYSTGIDILSIRREQKEQSPNGTSIWSYVIETDRGLISFETVGFKQKVRLQPILSESQNLTSRIESPI